MTKVKVKIEGHYEVQVIPYGKDYKWCRRTPRTQAAVRTVEFGLLSS